MPTSENRRFEITSFALHMLAMLFMLCDHMWATLFLSQDYLTWIGRIAFPLFAFMLAEGFVHTSDRKKYAKRLLIFALISELPFNLMLAGGLIYPLHQNVMFTFLLAFAAMSLCEKIRHRFSRLPGILLCLLTTLGFHFAGFITFVDYYGYGILTVLVFYFTRTTASDTKKRKYLSAAVQLFALYFINCELMGGLVIPITVGGSEILIHQQGFALLALPLIWLYRGKQGPYNKGIRILYYSFYPAHILILALLMILL